MLEGMGIEGIQGSGMAILDWLKEGCLLNDDSA